MQQSLLLVAPETVRAGNTAAKTALARSSAQSFAEIARGTCAG
jgi:hypothetical protein